MAQARDRPDDGLRRCYEYNEGGIGVLDQICSPDTWDAAANRALDILHVSCDGSDADHACLDSCYKCLRMFYNQWNHDNLDRTLVLPGFKASLEGVNISPRIRRRNQDAVISRFDSEMEREMVERLKAHRLPAPSDAHRGVPVARLVAQADLYYTGGGINAVVLLDGGIHDDPTIANLDKTKRASC